MAKLSIFGVLSNIQMLLHTSLHGKFVGKDQLGNKYYKGKARKGSKRERRWVIYTGDTEASMVPPEWHGWLHSQTDKVPPMENRNRKSWQLPHLPNQTGTAGAYLPPGHTLKGGNRAASSADITAWQPPE
ncbi:MAG: NADH:ubiquinone oxidoreductase subunit NDUFA12 [Alphaproteobacteria bacterium]|nr:NADH:ubiquinone oxidoreductase subunit NDUFA12 [Alphaproteobacteria bacterium]